MCLDPLQGPGYAETASGKVYIFPLQSAQLGSAHPSQAVEFSEPGVADLFEELPDGVFIPHVKLLTLRTWGCGGVYRVARQQPPLDAGSQGYMQDPVQLAYCSVA